MSVWVTSSLKTHFSTEMNFTVIKLIKTVCHDNEKSGTYMLTKFSDAQLASSFNGIMRRKSTTNCAWKSWRVRLNMVSPPL